MNEWTIWKVHSIEGQRSKYEFFGGASFRQGAVAIVQQLHSDGVNAVFAPPGFVPDKGRQW